MQLNAGRLLQGGKYIINHPLEIQGFGITYRGTQTESGQAVVLKTLHPALHKSRAFGRLSDRFTHLANCLAAVTHPQLVGVIDRFQEGEWPFMVMEYIYGKSLAEMVQPGQLIDEIAVLHYIREIAAGLQASHAQGLVHGNLKPNNIICRAENNACVVVGYGISAERMLAAVQYAVPGFPHAFTAPEQIGPSGDRVKTADLYGLAANLYYLLTGEAPLAATDRAEKSIDEQLPHLSRIRSGLQQVIRQGLALNPKARPPSVEAWLQMLPGSSSQAAVAPLEPQSTVAAMTQVSPQKTQQQARTLIDPTAIEPQPTPAPAPTPIELVPSPAEPVIAPVATAPPATITPERPRLRREPIELPDTAKAPPNRQSALPVRPAFREQPLPSPSRPPSPPRQPESTPTNAITADQAADSGQWFTFKRLLILCGIFAALGGVTFGLFLRLSTPRSPAGVSGGGGLFNAEQSFPTRQWEGTLEPVELEFAPLVEAGPMDAPPARVDYDYDRPALFQPRDPVSPIDEPRSDQAETAAPIEPDADRPSSLSDDVSQPAPLNDRGQPPIAPEIPAAPAPVAPIEVPIEAPIAPPRDDRSSAPLPPE